MPRAPKRTFKTLPAGASGSSTNPETAARNQRRRKLDPLQAEYERARANRGNRISSKIKRLKKQAAYINASTAERVSMEQAIRDTEESVYQADRAAIAQLHASMLAGAETGPDVSVADVSVADAVAADSAQLACLNGELSMAEPVRDAETARSADREGGVHQQKPGSLPAASDVLDAWDVRAPNFFTPSSGRMEVPGTSGSKDVRGTS